MQVPRAYHHDNSTLRTYLASLSVSDRHTFAARAGTTWCYLQKALSVNQRIGIPLAIQLEKQSGGAVRADELCPQVDWDYLKARLPEKAGQAKNAGAPGATAVNGRAAQGSGAMN
jgi:DNA-binding transcriptional regulator YdaS (Cro superfamily)